MVESKYIEDLKNKWTKNWPEHLPIAPNYPFGEIPITEYLVKRAKQTPDKPCIIFYGKEITYRELDEWSNRLTSYLLSIGLRKQDRVAVFLPNCPQFLIAFYGILKAGGVHVPVNPMFKTQELLYELQDTDAEFIITLDQLYPVIQSVKGETNIREIITTNLSEFLPEEPVIPLHPSMKDVLTAQAVDPDVESLSRILAEQSPEFPKVDISLDDLAALNYTGGTTGMPKGCEHTQRDMLYTSACNTTYTYLLSPEEVRLTYMPVFWIAGENSGVLAPVFSGATHLLLYRWDTKAVLEAIAQYNVSCMSAVMDNIVALMEHPELARYDLSSVKTTTVSSFVKKLTVEYRQRWHKLTGSVLRETAYGMTETHTSDTFTTGFQAGDFDLKSQPVFCGIPMPGTYLKIVDFQTGELMPPGKEGEIAIKTPSLMKGYWNKPEETRRVFRNGWFHTGDIGVIDDNGFLHFLGRKKEMLKVNGMSIFPSEIEMLMGKMQELEGCGVIGLEDEEKGQLPLAVVQLRAEYRNKMTEDDIQNWCKANMAPYKVPIVKIVEQLPLTTTGKVKKGELLKSLQVAKNQTNGKEILK
ncbi:AMP-binding protein [Pueribacillus theae]|uniref:AMP-binding protein n=1 Tax=Pueribacillus theae TaxID=2171751 RepID=UPI0019815DF2|nr:AMP-binding protein [Pueribacillus theae]